jgi:hypothetical protein
MCSYEFITAMHDTIRGTAYHHRTHGCIDEDIPQDFDIMHGNSRFVSKFRDSGR